MPRATTWTTDLDQLVVAEQPGRIRAHDRPENREHPLLRTAAAPAITPLFKQTECLRLIEITDLVVVQFVKPIEIAVRLRRNHDEVLRPITKIACRSLLTLIVILLDDSERLSPGKFNRAPARLSSFTHQIGIEQIATVVLYVFGEELADNHPTT